MVDVCQILGLPQRAAAIRKLSADDLDTIRLPTLCGEQADAVLSLFGLFNVVRQSRNPSARQFGRWLRHVLLPGTSVNCIIHNPTENAFLAALRDPEVFRVLLLDNIDQVEALQSRVEKLSLIVMNLAPWMTVSGARAPH